MKLERLVSMILILLQKERVGARELAELFEVSARTIYRDIDAINLAGIPVRATPGVGGGFEIMPQYKLDKKVFSSSDLSAILTGLSGLSGMMQSEALTNALTKVKSVVPAEKANEIALQTSQIHIDLTPWLGSGKIQPNLDLIQSAMREHRLLSFLYTGRSGDKTARIVEPYQLVLKGNQWYLHGFCRTKTDFRLLKLARVSNLILTNESFTPRVYPKPELDASDVVAAQQTRIQLRIHKSILERVLDVCDEEDILPDGDAHYIVSYPFIENEYFYGVLLSFSDRCVCLSPQHVRAGLKQRANAIASFYND